MIPGYILTFNDLLKFCLYINKSKDSNLKAHYTQITLEVVVLHHRKCPNQSQNHGGRNRSRTKTHHLQVTQQLRIIQLQRSVVTVPPRKETEASLKDASLLCAAVGSVKNASDDDWSWNSNM